MPTKLSDQLQHKLELLVRTGLLLTKSFETEAIVRLATDASLELCGAQFGAFFCNIIGFSGESRVLYSVSGADRDKFDASPTSHNIAILSSPFEDTGVIRSGDIIRDSRKTYNVPSHWNEQGHLPVRSYLAVPIENESGEVFGGFFYGHEEPDVFEQNSEYLVATVAAQTAVALEAARWRNRLTNKIGNLQQLEARQQEIAKGLGELAAIVESSDDPIISKNLNGIITSWNQAASRVFGFSSEEMIGQSILKLIPPHLHGDEKTIIENIRAGRRIEHFETVRLTKSGELLDVSLTISPVKDHTGEIVGASKILRDVSMKKRIEMSLLQSEKIAATGRMAATIAHEINNPLEAVINLLYLLRPMITDVEGISYLNAAESELSRVAHIAKQTLGYYREHASAKSASLSELVEHALAIYEPRCSAAGIKIERHIQPSQKVVLRKGEMMQVISNLVTNAIYAMPMGGTLKICVGDITDPAEGVALSIEDNGVGIPADNLTRIWEAFFTTRKSFGTGIGLFVAKQFIEGHGGKIKAESSVDPDRHSTKISLFLPLHTKYEDVSESSTE
ncbi:MAG TPA: PAS domain S-box protein [Edaphobacter sp.]